MVGAATSLELDIIRQGKACIEQDTLEDFAWFVSSLYTANFCPAPTWSFIVQKLYIHACLKKKADIAKYIEDLVGAYQARLWYPGWKDTMAYGKSLLAKTS